MGWNLTQDVEEYAAKAWALMAADPVASTIGLSIIEAIRADVSYSNVPPVFGWYEGEGGVVSGAISITPFWPLLLSVTSEETLPELASELRAWGVPLTEVHGTTTTAPAFASAWIEDQPLRADTTQRQGLYRLGELAAPVGTPGRSRVVAEDDVDLVARWSEDFTRVAGGPAQNQTTIARRFVESGTLCLWEIEAGEVVSMAGWRLPAAGVSRVGPVYTPPEHRRHGYGTAVTAACTQDALDGGAESVVLFTDLANPVSNSIYQAIGYRRVSDRVIMRFVPID
jgi:RimJ/RimL family protein N-acetyltransferase